MSRRHTDIPRGSDARRIAERRTRTVVDRNTAIPPIETLRQSVLDRVKHAFRHESGLRETHLDANTVAFVTDNVKVDGHISTLMEICAGRQMLISDQELIFAFDLREAKKEDKTDKGEGNTYLRSWAVTVRELLAIIAMWEEEGYHPPEVDAWLAMIRFLRLDDVVFLRYIGQAIGPNTPHARYWHDIAQRKDGFLGHFIAGLLEHAAGALRAGTCYVFPSARIPASPSGQKPTTLQDLREQVMIALFGKASLVNRQPGGVRPSYAPLAEDVARIERLNTSVFARLGALRALSPETTSIRSAMRAELCSLWNDYERFGNENPVATGTMAFPYRSATKEMQIKMADPTLIFHGGSLILCAGSHTTLDEYLNARPSLSTRSSAGVLTLQFIAEMEKVESGASIIQALSSYESIFPVMNLFPFTRRSDVGAHLALLRRGFETHRPWIVLSFSRAVSSCLASDFQTEHGLRASDKYLPHVGKPERHSFANNEWREDDDQDEAPEASYYICIKHLDAGVDKYKDQNETLRRVLNMTWNITFVVLDTLLKTPDAILLGSRQAAVIHVIEAAKRRLDDSGLRQVFDGLVSQLQQNWNSNQRHLSRLVLDAQKDSASAAATARVERNPFTEGAPNSRVRKSQAVRLWKTSNRDLHIYIAHIPENREVWLEWVGGIEEGRSIYMRALHDAGVERAGDELQNVLRSVPRPVGVPDGDEWMNDPILRADALERKGAQMREGLPDDHFSSENQRRRRLNMITTDPERRATYEYLETMHGREVNIQANGRILFYWLRNGNEQVTLEYVVSKSLVPSYETEMRFLSFVSDGIDILNESRKALRKTSRTGPWIPYGRLVTNSQSGLFLEMWDKNLPEDQRAAAEAARPSRPSVDTVRYGEKGRPFVKHGNKQTLPNLVPGDAAWLVDQFLTLHCPGARHDLISHAEDLRIKREPYTSIFRLWKEFLQAYKEHPYYAEWNQLSGDMSAWARHFQANVKLFRDIKTSKQLKVRVSGSDKWYRKWSIGAPGQPAADF